MATPKRARSIRSTAVLLGTALVAAGWAASVPAVVAQTRSPIFGGAAASPTTESENKAVLGKGYYADYYGSLGIQNAYYAHYYGTYGYYSTAQSYAYNAYYYYYYASYYQSYGM